MLKNWFGKDKKSLAEALDQEQNSAATVVVDQERSEENWVERLRDGLGKTRGGWVSSINKLFSEDINEEVLEEFEELLIEGDLGVQLTEECIEMLRVAAKQNLIEGPKDVSEILRDKFHTELAESAGTLSINHKPFTVIMMVGINGVGKTTTTAKLVHLFKGLDKTCLLIAGDTFRAGAVEQLKTWGSRLDCPVFAGSEGQDPASVVFDGISRARDLGVDLVLIDTAGRLHTQTNLMEEVKKIARVINKQCPGAPHEILMVIDSTTGQNAIQQARIFHNALNLTGLVVTKLDGTAKGGSLLAVHRELKIPVRFIGVGEQFNDLEYFNPKQFTQALFHEV
tara:strand:- start:397 stop:1413 length:1017 start_codon:yes stop_codon:yes gene_type:complete